MYDLIAKDKELFLFLNTLGEVQYDQFWILISEKWVWIPLYFIFLYLIFRNFRLKSVLFILLFIALGVVASDQISGIFKHGIARLRPCHDPSLEGLMREVECGGKYGFYSAHASNTFFIAMFMVMMLKNKIKSLAYFLFPWALIVSISRIYLGVHFPLDVVFGATVGILLGGFFSTLARNVVAKQNAAANSN